ncbi:UPF0481 protein At3g47200 [Olea europaea var. sylvestris]|uniref:UPF0481 protein At3g47200 n=1 Tax=Olea europaea var. sylvestris TaxID=158386 RepID=UPI000C1D15A5|nr:UPF0481 protein At3g47200 [Olea europaea var. sylvestris]
MAINKSFREDENNHHAIKIWEVNRDRLALMQQKISDTPSILSCSAGGSSCCIFRVPQSLIDINGRCYEPQIVSIGPYHHGKPHLKMIEEHKWRFLGTLLNRTQSEGLTLEDYLKAVQLLEKKARECYSAAISLSADEFTEMLVLDGCFVIELFRRIGEVVPIEGDDPLFCLSWVYTFFLRDLIRLENQIPFFILECLFDLTRMPCEESGPSLSTLTMNFFNNAMQRPDDFINKFHSHKGKHLLDFLRSSFIPEGYKEPEPGNYTNTHVIQCISKLRRAGIKLKVGNEDSFLVIKFRHGVIEMPSITIDDFMSSFLLNCVAYEQCHKSCSKHMTTYATFLDCLINTGKDVAYLSENNIIENYFGADAEISSFVNNLGKDVAFDIDVCYLSELFNEVNHYCRNHLHAHWASFKYTYFNTPWSFVSALAAFILLILTVAQTFFTIMAYVRPPKN